MKKVSIDVRFVMQKYFTIKPEHVGAIFKYVGPLAAVDTRPARLGSQQPSLKGSRKLEYCPLLRDEEFEVYWRRSRWKGQKLTVCAKIVFALYMVSLAHLSYDLHERYKCDNLRFLIKHSRKQGLNHTRQLVNELDHVCHKGVSNYFMFMHEFGILNLIITSFIAYLVFVLSSRFDTPLNFSFVHSLIDCGAELKNSNRRVHATCARFLDSMRFYSQNRVDWLSSHTRLGLPVAQKMLDKMLNLGLLMPENRKRSWVEQQAPIVSVFIVVVGLLGVCIIVLNWLLIYAGVQPTHQDQTNDTRLFDYVVESGISLEDMVIGAEVLFTSLILLCTIVLMLSIGLFAFMDQIRLYLILKRRIEQCIALNNFEYKLYLSTASSAKYFGCKTHFSGGCGGAYKAFYELDNILGETQNNVERKFVFAINERLMYCVMSFKIYVAQMELVLLANRWPAFCASLLAIIVPAGFMIHAPYIDDEEARRANFKSIVSITCFLATVATLSSITVAAIMYGRGKSLHSKMHALLSHVLATKITTGSDTNRSNATASSVTNPYDEFLTYALNCELHWPDSYVAKFVTHVFGIRFTYAQMLKLIFYGGLVLMFACFQDETYSQTQPRGLVADFFYDPLGLFRRSLASNSNAPVHE